MSFNVTDYLDIVDGKLDRDKAYTYAQERISRILEENPSVEVVIDLHRDGVSGNKRLVTNIDGKETAKIMFFNGLSRTKQNGEISYLPNPYIQENFGVFFADDAGNKEVLSGYCKNHLFERISL